ncbi:unnamed protein product [Linum tenue]|uniref:Uncharacterized protein n=1 Tax=Linum tenue TaxID=586396 RepID=A0AAV0NQ68_9ROSI|nr:unnamed protein product [Linum tenue]
MVTRGSCPLEGRGGGRWRRRRGLHQSRRRML